MPTTKLSDADWDTLITQIVDGRAIPILGPALIQTQKGALDEILLTSLKARYPGGDSTHGLRRYVQNILGQAGSSNAPGLLRDFLRDEHLKLPKGPPREIQQLAEIGFSLYVSLTSDNYLVEALKGCNKVPEEHGFHSQKSSSDIAPDKVNAPQTPAVYRLFSTPKDDYPWTDEEVLEYIYKLQGNRRTKNLFRAFSESYLLFLGCDFPDWLMRMFVRLVTGTNVSGLKYPVAVVDGASAVEIPLSQFLRRSKQVVLPGDSAARFIAELHGRWPKRTPVPDARAGHVFLSFIRMDRAQAHKVRDELKARNVPFWYDEDPGRLSHGGNWREELVRNIERSAVFIPFISQHTCTHVAREAYRLEWNHALQHRREFAEDYRFIRPIRTDPGVDMQQGEYIPDSWRGLQAPTLSSINYDTLAKELHVALDIYARRFS